MPQAAWLSMLFEAKYVLLYFREGPAREHTTEMIGSRRKKPSTRWDLNLSVKRHVLFHCATTSAQLYSIVTRKDWRPLDDDGHVGVSVVGVGDLRPVAVVVGQVRRDLESPVRKFDFELTCKANNGNGWAVVVVKWSASSPSTRTIGVQFQVIR